MELGGDKKYLTLEAIDALKDSEVVVAINNKGKTQALDTVRDFLDGKKVVEVKSDMLNVGDDHYEKLAQTIKENLANSNVSFIMIGDAMIYSSYLNLEKYLSNIDIRLVSGIPSFVAAAARINMPLVLKGESFTLIDSLDSLPNQDSFALLKARGLDIKDLEKLESSGYELSLVKRLSLDGEEILRGSENIIKNRSYMALILGRKKNG